MRKGKNALALFSAAVLLVILLMAIHTTPAQGISDPVLIRAGEETVRVWSEDGTNYYAFLPVHAGQKETLILPAQDAVTVDTRLLSNEGEPLEPGKTYALSWQEGGQPRQGTLQLLSGQGVATLHLQTQSGSMDYIHEEKGNAERGSLRLYDESGSLNYSGSLSAIRGRGNSTWVVHEKKPYSLELTEEADLLGMGAARKWVLLADALDSSALRNKIVLDFAAGLGMPYTPQTRWTEVFLNGEYAGLYLLCERVEIDPQRLDLTPDGSLICMDRDIRIQEDTDPWFVTEAGQYIQIRKTSDIGALKERIQAMENAVLSDGDRWKDCIDLDSWTKKYLIEELFGSYDAGFQSQFFFLEETGANSRVYAGPVWDYDSSLGNPLVWSLNSPRGLYAWRPEAMAGYSTPWLHSLYEKEEFRKALQELYRTVAIPMLEELTEEGLESCSARIATAFQRNRIRWQVQTDGIDAETAHIGDYLRERREFLNLLWLEEREFCILRLQEDPDGGYYGYYAAEPGTCFDALPEREEENFLGWYREDTDTRFDPAQPVTEDLRLYPKFSEEVPVAAEREEGMIRKILKIYNYVPAVIFVLMGAVLVPFGIQKGRTGRKREPSKTR